MKIAIIGAGIMGQLTALSLLKKGHSVDIYEKAPHDALFNCSKAAAGMLCGLAELEKSNFAVYQLAKDSLENHWARLRQDFGENVYFAQRGSLLISHPQDRAEVERFVATLSNKLNQKAIVQKLNDSELEQLEPDLSKFDSAYYLPDEAQVDNQALMEYLEQFLTHLGVNWHFATEVKVVSPYKISYSDHTKQFDWVIDCRGLAAKDQFNELRGVRGELIWLKAPEVKIKHMVRLLHPRYSLYVVPRPGNIYLLGASEIESEDFSEISVRTSLELLSAAYYLHSGFAEARILKMLTHCRPTLNHHEPRIKVASGLVAVNGLYRHGFLLAPALAHEIVNYIEQGASAIHYPQFWEEIC